MVGRGVEGKGGSEMARGVGDDLVRGEETINGGRFIVKAQRSIGRLGEPSTWAISIIG